MSSSAALQTEANIGLNPITLRAAVAASPTARAVYEALKARKRHRKMTDLRQFVKKVSGAQSDDYLKFFKAMQDAGAGTLRIKVRGTGEGEIKGLGGQPPRFEWKYDFREVIKTIEGERATPAAPTAPIPSDVSHHDISQMTAQVANPAPVSEAQVATGNVAPISSGKKKKKKGSKGNVAQDTSPGSAYQREAEAASAAMRTAAPLAPANNVLPIRTELRVVMERANGNKVIINLPTDLTPDEVHSLGDRIKAMR